MKNRTGSVQTTRQIFKWPLVIAILSTVGLISALVGDEWYDALSWLALGLTIPLMIFFLARRD